MPLTSRPWIAHGLLQSVSVAFLLAMLPSQTVLAFGEISAPPWTHCIITIGDYFTPTSRTEYYWQPNHCGFKVFRPKDVRKEVLFGERSKSRRATKAIAFAGDSTGLRDFTQAINMVATPVEINTIYKVASVPARWPIVTFEPPFSREEVDEGGFARPDRLDISTLQRERAMTNITYYNMRYAFFAEGVLREEIRRVCAAPDNNGGFFFVTLGNWDLNWKTHKKERVPGLSRKFDFGAATAYWTHYVSRMFIAIHEEGEACRALTRSDGRSPIPPIVIIREQFMPNCAAPRFSSSKHRKFKQCSSFIVPTVVPMYRRVLRGLGWAMGIPVVPTDHMFREGYRYCGISDGLHLDPPCMDVEQQLLWNVASLLSARGPTRQAWGSRELRGINESELSSLYTSNNHTMAIGVVAQMMVNVTDHERWMDFLGLKDIYDGKVSSPTAPRTESPQVAVERVTNACAHTEGEIVLEVVALNNGNRTAESTWRPSVWLDFKTIFFFNIVLVSLILLVLREMRNDATGNHGGLAQ